MLRLWLVPAIVFFAGPSLCAPTYRVLTVGYTKSLTSEEDHYGGANPLIGDYDVTRFTEMLRVRFNVPESSIRTLVGPDQVKKELIVNEFRRFLIDEAAKDDVIIFYFSGHGTRYPDLSTGLKGEAFLMSDSRINLVDDPASGKKLMQLRTSTLLTDRELNELLDELSAKGCENVTVIVDSCHAGGMVRGDAISKGLSIEGSPVSSGQLFALAQESGSSMAGQSRRRGHVGLLATDAATEAYQVKDGGVFTTALIKAFEQENRSYDDLIRRVAFHMSSNPLESRPLQRPMLTGDKGRVVFGGNYVPIPTTFGLGIDARTNQTLLLAGEVLGIRKGYVIGLYPSTEERFSGPPAFRAKVTSTSSARSTLEFVGDKQPDRPFLESAKAIVIEALGEVKLQVRLDNAISESAKALLREAIAKSPYLAETANANGYDIEVKQTPSGYDFLDGLARRLHSGVPLDDVPKTLRKLALGKALLLLSREGQPTFSVDVEVVKVRVDANEACIEILGDMTALGAVKAGSEYYTYRIRLSPTTTSSRVENVYVTGLFVRPDGTPGQFWPNPVWTAARQYAIPVDGTWRYIGKLGNAISANEANPQALNDIQVHRTSQSAVDDAVWVIKFIATTAPENFSGLVDFNQAAGARSGSTSLGTLFEAFNKDRQLGARNSYGVSDWAQAEIRMRVING
ncbi:MAG: caspase family protein [Fimbriimonadales bacterium]|nr:caspase family protein [Fimbriimonadales bacterium]